MKKEMYLNSVKLRPPEIAELFFDIFYLCFAFVTGIYLLNAADGRAALTLYGVLALTLGGGDAFHLLPRIYSIITGTMKQNYKALGFGKAVTSLTMTAFYMMLIYLWQIMFGVLSPIFWVAAWALAIIRIVLCIMPQNRWLSQNPPLSRGVLRNIPFVILGALTLALYFFGNAHVDQNGLKYMWLAILLSFAFYLPVVLFAHKYPALGALMLPKTCAYIWILCMGFSLA